MNAIGSTNVQVVVDRSFDLGENPLWDERRQVYLWTDINAGQVWEYDPGLNVSRCRYEGPPVGGFTLQADGALLLFRVDDIARLGLDGRVRMVTTFVDHRAKRFNDVIATPDGSVLAGTIGRDDRSGGVYHVTRDGRVHPLFHRTGISNGMGFSPDLRTWYWTCSTQREIWRFDYDAERGAVGLDTGRRIYEAKHHDPDHVVPDGLAVDTQGRLWSARWGGSCVVQHDTDGRVIRRIDVPTAKVTSLAFGGPNLDEMLITTSQGPVYLSRPGVRGRREFRSRIDV